MVIFHSYINASSQSLAMCPLWLGFAAEGSRRSRDDLVNNRRTVVQNLELVGFIWIQLDIYIYMYMHMYMYNSFIRNDNGTIIGIQWEFTLQ